MVWNIQRGDSSTEESPRFVFGDNVEAEILTDAEAAELGLPAHVPGEKDAEIEWGRPRKSPVSGHESPVEPSPVGSGLVLGLTGKYVEFFLPAN